ncbi:tRNA (adenosine(37)-N6)-threonylcarbamoyltransferase complex transferase subunit TsaD [Candidatus Omnitrophota bacterium]
MYTLGIETSCDETSVAVVAKRKVSSCKTFSSIRLHAKYGGVIPEIASRRHLKFIDHVTTLALKDAGIRAKDIGLVAVTREPGLIGSLLVGLRFAESLAYSLDVPLLGIDHLHAHLFAAFLDRPKVTLPFLGLVASGGHTQIYRVNDLFQFRLIAQTRDDACGEALDKVGRYYGLGFPAGAKIDSLFRAEWVEERLFRMKSLERFDFSFSGIKTKAVYLHDQLQKEGTLTEKRVTGILSSFQYAVVDSLINNLTRSVKKFKIGTVVCGGGVVANSLLRARLADLRKSLGLELLLPPIKYCQDNAAGVAGLGEYLYAKRKP